MAGIREMWERRKRMRRWKRIAGGSSLSDEAEVRVTAGKEYRGGYDDTVVDGFAVEDGNKSLHDVSVWGENTEPRTIEMFLASVPVLRHLVGHRFRQEALPLEVELEDMVRAAQAAEQQALDDIDQEGVARAEEVALEHRTREKKLVPPQLEDLRRYAAKLGLLVCGDLALISVAYQVFGLSDRLLLGFVPYSSDLYIAALSSVLALMFLAHHAGEELKAISHARRLSQEGKDPTLGRGSRVLAGLWLAGVAAILIGVAAVRGVYLAKRGHDDHTMVFLLIQTGVFLAALSISISHAHPLARQWAQVRHWVKRLKGQAERSASRHAELVGHVNGLIDRRDALMAMAGQHARLGETDISRQILLYVRRVQLSQPEPVGERLFPEELPSLDELSDDDLEKLIVGIGEKPKFERLDTDAVTQRRSDLRTDLDTQRRNLGISGWWGQHPAQLILDPRHAVAPSNGSGE